MSRTNLPWRALSVAFLALACAPSQDLRQDQQVLLDVAYRSASALPSDPHIKTRSRLQESVVLAALERGAWSRVEAMADGIGNWRRGACYADLAHAVLERGRGKGQEQGQEQGQEPGPRAAPLLAKAKRVIAELRQTADEQAWRWERIEAKVARAESLLVSPAAARGDGDTIVPQAPSAKLTDFLAYLDDALVRGSFDELQSVLERGVVLFDQVFADEEARTPLETKLLAAGAKLPPQVRFQTLRGFALAATKHGALPLACDYAGRMQQVVDGQRWLPEHRIPLLSQLARVQFEAGARMQADENATAAAKLFDREGSAIVDIYRADALVPLAEAYVAMGLLDRARRIYERALTEAFENPNGRPRAEDLVALCCSILGADFNPGDSLLAAIAEAHSKLSAPW